MNKRDGSSAPSFDPNFDLTSIIPDNMVMVVVWKDPRGIIQVGAGMLNLQESVNLLISGAAILAEAERIDFPIGVGDSDVLELEPRHEC